jgi:hypothetical protein
LARDESLTLLKEFTAKEQENMGRSAIRVDRDGTWYYEGREIIRKEILSLFYDALHLDEKGYHLEIQGERARLDVEDTVFIVKEAELVKDSDEAFIIWLNDGSQERLDLSTFRIAEGNVPYCLVKEGRFPARFLRLPFYQLAQHAQHDEDTNEYFIVLNKRKYPLQGSS